MTTSTACSRKNDDGSPTTPTAPTPPAANAPVHYTALGASDAVGIGASRVCVPLAPCPDGTGYVPVIARQLSAGRSFTLTNLGIPGAVLGPSTQSLARQIGRDVFANFVDNELPFVPRETTVATIFAGGNDTNTIAAAVEAGAGGSDRGAFVARQVRDFGTDFDRVIRGVRDRAPSARIVVANLPNLALLPYATGYGTERRQLLQEISVGFSRDVINPLAAQGVVVVDLLCDSRSYDGGSYSSDGFHPNDRGYGYMAERMLAAINGVPPSPRTCPEMQRF
jgi:lysophospholipase L1-like esterase